VNLFANGTSTAPYGRGSGGDEIRFAAGDGCEARQRAEAGRKDGSQEWRPHIAVRSGLRGDDGRSGIGLGTRSIVVRVGRRWRSGTHSLYRSPLAAARLAECTPFTVAPYNRSLWSRLVLGFDGSGQMVLRFRHPPLPPVAALAGMRLASRRGMAAKPDREPKPAGKPARRNCGPTSLCEAVCAETTGGAGLGWGRGV
jgi:hypothetical protein